MNLKVVVSDIKEAKRKVWWIELLGSAFIFTSVYLLLYIAYQSATATAASYFGLDPVLYMDHISYESGYNWYPHAVKRTFLVGAIFIGILGVVFYFAYALLRKTFVFVRLFLLWASVISFSMLAQRLIGVLISGNFEFRKLGEIGFELSVFGAYMYYDDATFKLMAFLGFLLLGLVGFLVGKPFLQTAWSTEQIGSETPRFNFLKYQVVLPYFVGAFFVTLVVYPDNVVTNAVAFTCIGLCLAFAMVRAMLLGSMPIPRQKDWERWALVPALMLAATFIFIKTALSSGLHF